VNPVSENGVGNRFMDGKRGPAFTKDHYEL
jgi:hypothetical protein